MCGGAEGGVVVCESNINILVNIARGMGEGCVCEGAEEGCAGGGGGGVRGGGGEVAGVVAGGACEFFLWIHDAEIPIEKF